MEIVHSLRLNIKKIHTTLTIINFNADSNTDKQSIEIINTIFLLSGSLRDAQVQTILLESYKKGVGEEFPIVIDIINKQKKKIRKQLISRIHKLNPFDIILFNQRLDNAIETISSSEVEVKCQLRIKHLEEQINLLIREKSDASRLHLIRKQLKELIYTLSILKKGRTAIKHDPSFIKCLNALQQKIGFWHDLDILLNRIAKVRSQKVEFKHLIEHLAHDKATVRGEILI